ncbi:MAG: nitroreductase family protein [bacterium]|nr:nitroreductase family protein [Candidatus Sumerlaeota bacterium]
MNVFEAIEKRHSYRGAFTDQLLPRQDLRRIVQAGIQAPSGCNKQTTSFVIVDEPELVQRIRQLHPRNQAMCTAQAYIACVVDRNPPAVYADYQFQVEDCSTATENILLAVTALGYATVWIDGWLRLENHADAIGELLALPQDKILRIILPIGVPAEMHMQRDKIPFDQRAWFNRYNSLGE